MRVLVTGGSGYVGRVVCERLVREHDVTNFDRNPPPQPLGQFLRGDILNSAHLMYAMRGVEAVVHLAAIPHPMHDPSDAVMNVNVMGTQRVVEAAALGSPKRIVVASSDSTFGFVFGKGRIMPEYLPIDEAHPTRPPDCYGLSKLIKEEICRRYTRDLGLETVCLR
jgi:nucleoside-diphosphate-sugar epimerase